MAVMVYKLGTPNIYYGFLALKEWIKEKDRKKKTFPSEFVDEAELENLRRRQAYLTLFANPE
eukprot:CAMPEP_0184055272 /NCGR_PEP_ID=MMETSP0956-20121227/7083_1 /TAXON_ID=627963 /ORGANISM="Aplanochytrium sp, Strain PBS07" /LENGTH=61 /DNA_ID=CAMNT_0026349075 /DNA_START=99 /DNA_END=284 /DNA_ORIENTATION=+